MRTHPLSLVLPPGWRPWAFRSAIARLLALLTLSAGMLSSSSSQAASWRALGPTGGYFVQFAADPTDGRIVYAGGDDSSGIWKSIDSGSSWRLVTEELANVTGWGLEIDPRDPKVVYAADMYGRHPVLKSIDGGETWKELGTGLTTRRTNSIAVDPGDSRVVYLSTGDGERGGGDGVFKSIDGGQTWSPAGLQGQVALELDITSQGTLFVLTEEGVYRSTDHASSWQLAPGLDPVSFSALHVSTRDTVYAGRFKLARTISISQDEGQTWSSSGLSPRMLWDMLEDRANARTLYCATILDDTGIYRSTNGGRTFQAASSGLEAKWVIGLGQSAGGALFSSTYANEGIYRSTDGAKSWSNVNTGLNGYFATGLAFAPTDPSMLLVSTLGSYNSSSSSWAARTFLGTKTGDTVSWKKLPVRAQTYSPAFSPESPSTFMMGSWEQGFFFTRDGGATFEQPTRTGTCVATAFDPDDGAVAMASVWSIKTLKASTWQTRDGGASWISVSGPGVVSRFVAEAGSPRVLAATLDGVYESPDNGLTWDFLGLDGLELNALVQHPENPDLIYAAGGQAIFRSDDGGLTWTELTHPTWPEGSGVKHLELDPGDPHRLYVGLNSAEVILEENDALRGGVWTTSDSGASWLELTGGLSNDHVYGGMVLQLEGGRRTLYIATYGAGIQALAL